MADQVGPGTLDNPASRSQVARAAEIGPTGKMEHNHGRPVSWIAVTIIVAGFLVGGLGMVFGPTWWLAWLGGGIVIVGGILALATGIFNDWY